MNKKTNISWTEFFVGAFISAILCCCIFSFSRDRDSNSVETATNVSSNTIELDDGSTLVKYDTNIKDWKFKVSGKELTFNTPETFYSLSDQYVDNLKEYYGVDSININELAVVGDKSSLYDTNTVINASALSTVSSILSEIYGDAFDTEDVVMSEAYTYMTTGSLPEALPLNYKIDEVDTYTIEGVNFKVYEVNYDTEYVDDTVSENDSSGKTTVHTQQLACYSDTEDPIEVILYQTNFNREEAVNYLKEFLGVK